MKRGIGKLSRSDRGTKTRGSRDLLRSATDPVSAETLKILFIAGVSGALALGYEILWSRILSLQTGFDIWAYAVVGSAFMAGLAIGSWWIEPRLDGETSPLRVYARLELGIAGFAVSFPLFMKGITFVLIVLRGAGFTFSSLSTAAAILGGLAILGPSILMGATLPALARSLGGSRRFSLLYGFNCAGAAAGALLVTFYVIAGLGHLKTGLLLAAGNVLIALLARNLDGFSSDRGETSPAKRNLSIDRNSLGIGVIVLIAGATSMATQLLWTRGLVLIVGSSTYAFAMILSVYIASLSMGSFLSRYAERIDVRKALFACLAGLGLFSLLGRILLAHLPIWAILGYGTRLYLDPIRVLWNLTLAAIAVGPTAILSGALLPLAIRAESETTGQTSIGSLYALNTCGAILGNVAAGFVLLPTVGLENSFSIIGGLSLLTCLIPGRNFSVRKRLVALAPACIAGFLLLAVDGPTPEVMHSGAYISAPDYLADANKFGKPLRDVVQGSGKILFATEGTYAQIGVKEIPSGGRALMINGKADASTSLDMKAQRLLGHLPMLLKPDARRALVVGYGAGITAGSILAHPIEHLTIAEISTEVLSASDYFRRQNRDPLSDPRTRVLVGDGRMVAALLDETFDIVSSEPTNPWIAGVAALFTQEYFTNLRQRLVPGGLAVQWIQGYSIRAADFRSVVKTFQSVFPKTYLFRAFSGSDYVMVGSDRNLDLDLERMDESFKMTLVRRDLRDIDIFDSKDIASHLLATPMMLAHFSQGGEFQVDDRLALEFAATRALNSNDGVWIEPALDGKVPVLELIRSSDTQLAEQIQMRTWRYIAYDCLHSNRFDEFSQALEKAQALAGKLGESANILETLNVALAQRLQMMGELEKAESGLRKYVDSEPESMIYRTELATTLLRRGKIQEALSILDGVLSKDPQNLQALKGLAMISEVGGGNDRALALYERLIQLDPYDARLDISAARVLNNLGLVEEAKKSWIRAQSKDPALIADRSPFDDDGSSIVIQ